MPETWDEQARKEYLKPDEPINTRASGLAKIGAPVAAFIATIAASVGGFISDAPAAETIIAVAIVVATSVAGLFYVFAADFRSRAAVAVSRFEGLTKMAMAEVKATEAAVAEAEGKVSSSESKVAAAKEAEQKADKERRVAYTARDAALADRATFEAKLDDALARAETAETQVAKLQQELVVSQSLGRTSSAVRESDDETLEEFVAKMIANLRTAFGRDD